MYLKLEKKKSPIRAKSLRERSYLTILSNVIDVLLMRYY